MSKSNTISPLRSSICWLFCAIYQCLGIGQCQICPTSISKAFFYYSPKKTLANIIFINWESQYLTLKGRRSLFFFNNTSNLPFLAQEAQKKLLKFFALWTVGSCQRLLRDLVQKVLQKLTAQLMRLYQAHIIT
jgi:hypothetical protein